MKKYTKSILIALALILSLALFIGCNPDDSGGNGGNTDTPVLPVVKYSVEYKVDGTVTKTVANLVKGTTLTDVPSSPSKFGYDFTGWYSDEDLTKKWDFENDTVTSSITLYAGWERNGLSLDAEITDWKAYEKDEESGAYVLRLANEIYQHRFSDDNLVLSDNAKLEIYLDAGLSYKADTLVLLNNGDNFFYYKVTAEAGNSVVYKVNIRRTPKYTVKFYIDTLPTQSSLFAQQDYNENDAITPPDATNARPGWTFEYWYYADGNRKVVLDVENFKVNSNLVVYPEWSKNTYNVTLDGNGGIINGVSERTIEYGQAPGGLGGYTFAVATHEIAAFGGWYYGDRQVSDERGALIISWDIPNDVTLTAKWNFNEYTLNIVYDETAGSVEGDGKYPYDAVIDLVATPQAGYSFLGWYDAEDKLISAEKEYSFSFAEPKNTTLSAKFEIISFSITMYNNYEGAEQPAVITVDYGDAVSLTPPDVERTGFRFKGWGFKSGTGDNVSYQLITDAEGQPAYNFGEKWTYTSPIEVYAVWEEDVYFVAVINTNKNAGTFTKKTTFTETLEIPEDLVGAENYEGLYDDSFAFSDSGQAIVEAIDDGYQFRGWYVVYNPEEIPVGDFKDVEIFEIGEKFLISRDTGSMYTPSISDGVSSNLLIMALWERRIVTLNYNLDGGTFADTSITSTTIEYGKTGVQLDVPTKQFHIFKGWEICINSTTGQYEIFTDKNGVTLYEFKRKDAEVQLRAKWEPEKFTARITTNDADGGYATVSPGETQYWHTEMTASVTLKTGYEFAGWYDITKSEEGVPITDNVNPDNHSLTFTLEGNISIQARFKAKEITVSFDGGFEGADAIADKKVKFNSIDNLGTIDRKGDKQYEFKGWYYLDSSGNKKMLTDETGKLLAKWSIAEDITLTADWKYILTVSGGMVSSISAYGRTLEEVIIPDTLDGVLITGINAGVFADMTALKRVAIGVNVKTIGARAFENCVSLGATLTENGNAGQAGGVVFTSGSKLETVGDNAFAGCVNLTKLELPRTVVSLGSNMLSGDKNLAELHMPGNITLGKLFGSNYSAEMQKVMQDTKYYYISPALTTVTVTSSERSPITKIVDFAFADCKQLTTVNLPASVTTIGNRAFDGCEKLVSLGTNGLSNIVSIGNGAFRGSGLTAVSLSSIKKLGANAFQDSALTEVQLGSALRIIPSAAFSGSAQLASVTMPDGGSLTDIEKYAFEGCIALTSFDLGSTVNVLGIGAFANSGITDANNDFNAVKEVGRYAFENTPWVDNAGELKYVGKVFYLYAGTSTSVTIDNTITAIASGAFADSAVTSVNFNALTSLISIGESAFENSALVSAVLPSSVTKIEAKAFMNAKSLTTFGSGAAVLIGYSAFEGCTALNSVTLAEGLEILGERVFYGNTSLVSIALPSTLLVMQESAFEGNTSLTNVTFNTKAASADNEPLYNITAISDKTFKGCVSLASILLPNTVLSVGNSVFENCTSLTTVKFQRDLKPESGETSAETELPSYEQAKITTLGGSVFKNNSKLVNITLPQTLKTLGDSAFDGCESLTTISLKYITNIPDYAFNNCVKLTNVEFSTSIKAIGSFAFYRAETMTAVTIPAAVETIGDSAFALAKRLTSVTLNEGSLKVIGERAFLGNELLTSISIPSSVTTISTEAFSDCRSLTKVNIDLNKSKLETIGIQAFSSCSGLTTLELPLSLKTIYNDAFSGCTGLTTITVQSNVQAIGARAFKDSLYLEVKFVSTSAPVLGTDVFNITANSNVKLVISAEYVNDFLAADGWEVFAEQANRDKFILAA